MYYNYWYELKDKVKMMIIMLTLNKRVHMVATLQWTLIQLMELLLPSKWILKQLMLLAIAAYCFVELQFKSTDSNFSLHTVKTWWMMWESSRVAALIATTIGGWGDFYVVWQLYTKEDLSEAKEDLKEDLCEAKNDIIKLETRIDKNNISQRISLVNPPNYQINCTTI